MFRIDTGSPVPVYEQLKRQVRLGIVTGGFPPDYRMPSIRDLAAQLTVNPNTIAKAYQQLEAEGYLVSRAGSGFFVNPGEHRVIETRKQLFAELADEFVARALELGVSPERILNDLEAALTGRSISDTTG